MDFQPVTDSLAPVAQQDPKEKAPTASPDGTARGVRIYRTGQIDEKYTRALKELKERFQGLTDGNRNRREYMKKCLKLLEFFRGNQYAWWDYTTGSWQTSSTLSGGKLAGVTYSNAQALYVLNFMQGYLLSIMALLVGNKLTVRFFPDDPEQNRSLTAAQK